MSRFRPALTAFAFVLTATPGLAFGVSVDLPRLDFPTAPAETTRGCATVTAPSGTSCVQGG